MRMMFWRFADQRLDTNKRLQVLEMLLETEPGTEYPYPEWLASLGVV